jgi:glycosyltransferase involved in cell wall biosynthesis
MKVVLDGRPLLTPKTGVGHYTASLGEGLAKLGVEVRYLTIRFRGGSIEMPSGTKELRVMFPGTPAWMWWQKVRWPPVELVSGGIDLSHGTNFMMLPSRAPRVATIHDLAFVLHPSTVKPALRHTLMDQVPKALRDCVAVIVPSDYVKGRVLEAFGADGSKVHVIPEGVRDEFWETRAASGDPGSHEPFILWAGTHEPRKNLKTVLEAFSTVIESRADLRLVLCGPPGDERVSKEIESLGISSRVDLKGYVSDLELATLMSRALCFLFPSIDEGFGLPALEAMAAGTPVIAGRAGALPEVVGEAALLVEPTDSQAIAEGVIRIAESEKLRDDLAALGKKRASAFTWDAAAARTLDLYRTILG